MTDPKNCGTAGNVVPTAPHATTGCKNGVSAIISCSTGYTDKDEAFANGCEAKTTPGGSSASGQCVARALSSARVQGDPIPGVDVSIEQNPSGIKVTTNVSGGSGGCSTNASGQISVTGLTPGSYTFKWKVGKRSYQQTVTTTAAAKVANLRLQKVVGKGSCGPGFTFNTDICVALAKSHQVLSQQGQA